MVVVDPSAVALTRPATATITMNSVITNATATSADATPAWAGPRRARSCAGRMAPDSPPSRRRRPPCEPPPTATGLHGSRHRTVYVRSTDCPARLPQPQRRGYHRPGGPRDDHDQPSDPPDRSDQAC